MAHEQNRQFQHKKSFPRQVLSDIFTGAVIGAALDVAVPYENQESLQNSLWDGLYVALPFGVMAGRYEGVMGGVRSSTAGYIGSVAGQMLMNVMKMYLS